ncbi:MAG: hypothetical protein K6G81_07825 [Lachnospiraceae bacterium]|nr:hypothetical protein [Lachnospiraceae bacterium]
MPKGTVLFEDIVGGKYPKHYKRGEYPEAVCRSNPEGGDHLMEPISGDSLWKIKAVGLRCRYCGLTKTDVFIGSIQIW